MSDGAIYTRAAVLAWASSILEGEYASFADVPACELALLLYGIINNRRTQNSSAASAFTPISLQEIQFPAQTGAGNTDVIRLRNAQHVLALLRNCAAEATAFAAQDAAVPQLTVSENLTAVAWMGGKAFVEELKVWRWVRALANYWSLTVDDVKRQIYCFVKEGERGSACSTGAPVSLSPAPAVRWEGNELTSSSPHKVRATASKKGTKHLRSVDEGASDNVGGTEHRRSADPFCTSGATEMPEEKAVDTDSSPVKVQRRENTGPVLAPADSPSPSATSRPNGLLGDAPGAVAGALWRCHEALLTAFNKTCTGSECSVVGQANAAPATPTPSTTAAAVALPVFPVFAATEEKQRTQCCSSCPAVFALALEGNLQRLAKLEKARKLAIAACVKKDMTELMSALNELS